MNMDTIVVHVYKKKQISKNNIQHYDELECIKN